MTLVKENQGERVFDYRQQAVVWRVWGFCCWFGLERFLEMILLAWGASQMEGTTGEGMQFVR